MKTIINKFSLSLLTASILAAPSAFAATDHGIGISKALSESTVAVSVRARHEGVQEDGFEESSNAGTIKSRITVNTGTYSDFSLGLEVDNVAAVTEDYNSTANDQPNHPVVADPEGTDINQAFIKYVGDGYTMTGGRQRITHNNQRFVGGVAWRQNEQTYDGFRAQYANEDLSLDYSFLANVNTPTGTNDDGRFHLFNANYLINEDHKLAAFAYILDFKWKTALSTSTYGASYNGTFYDVILNASVATQSDSGSSRADFSALYANAELGYNFGPATFLAGYELLGSDNGVGFSTPLATKHKFNGWADKFLGTPDEGLQDFYMTLKGEVIGIKLQGTFHQFSSDVDDINFGGELDLVASYDIDDNYGVLVKYANYSQGYASTSQTDTDKVWVQVVANF